MRIPKFGGKQYTILLIIFSRLYILKSTTARSSMSFYLTLSIASTLDLLSYVYLIWNRP